MDFLLFFLIPPLNVIQLSFTHFLTDPLDSHLQKSKEAVKAKCYQHVSSREAVPSTKIKRFEFLEIKSSKRMNSKKAKWRDEAVIKGLLREGQGDGSCPSQYTWLPTPLCISG